MGLKVYLGWKDALNNLESSLDDLPATVPAPGHDEDDGNIHDDYEDLHDDGNPAWASQGPVTKIMMKITVIVMILNIAGATFQGHSQT